MRLPSAFTLPSFRLHGGITFNLHGHVYGRDGVKVEGDGKKGDLAINVYRNIMPRNE
jgi:hypothetical protein